MKFEKIKSLLPDYAKDTKLNLSSLSNETILEESAFAGIVLTSCLTTQNKEMISMVPVSYTHLTLPTIYPV